MSGVLLQTLDYVRPIPAFHAGVLISYLSKGPFGIGHILIVMADMDTKALYPI